MFRLQELSGEQLDTRDQHVLAVPAQGAGGHPSEAGEGCVQCAYHDRVQNTVQFEGII